MWDLGDREAGWEGDRRIKQETFERKKQLMVDLMHFKGKDNPPHTHTLKKKGEREKDGSA